MNSTFTIMLAISQIALGYSQSTYQNTFGVKTNNSCIDVKSTNDGGYIFTGLTTSGPNDSMDVVVLKTNNVGDTTWTATVNIKYEDFSKKVIQTSDSGFAIVGYTKNSSTGFYQIFILKLDSIGNLLWTKTYGDTIGSFKAHDIMETPESDLIIIGEGYLLFSSFIAIKLDRYGNLLWQNSYGRGRGIALTISSDGTYLLVGHGVVPFTGSIYIIKTDTSGNQIWNRGFDVGNEEYPIAIHQTFDNGFVISGASWGMGIGEIDLFLLKIDSLGFFTWSKAFGTTSSETVGCSLLMPDGSVILGGGTWNPNGSKYDYLLIKTNSFGDTLWTKTIGGSSNEHLNGLSYNEIDEILICGVSTSFSSNSDMYLIKTDTMLGVFCNQTIMSVDVATPAFQSGTNTFTSLSYGNIYNELPIVNRSGNLNTLCTSVGIQQSIQSNISIYPNPTNSDIFVKFNQVITKGEINIYSLQGLKVYTSSIDGRSEMNIDLSKLSSGIYNIKMASEGLYTFSKMVIVTE